jgi:hypothetical protein
MLLMPQRLLSSMVRRTQSPRTGCSLVPRTNVPLAFVPETQELLLGCRTPATALLLNATDGSEIAAVPSSPGADDIFYDATTRRAYVIAGSGAIDVLELSGGKLRNIGKVETAPGAKTGLLIPALHQLFVGIPSGGSQSSQVRIFSTQH